MDGLAGGTRPVILIDGGAGAGKTTLAQELVAEAGTGLELVSLDELYPGWDGLAAASALVPQIIADRRFRTWDWTAAAPGGWRELEPSRGVVIEGCGAISPASVAVCDLAVWLELPADRRRERALARDGETFARHWDQWAAQESAHWERDHPRELADLVLRPR